MSRIPSVIIRNMDMAYISFCPQNGLSYVCFLNIHMYGINVIYTMKPGKRDEFLAGVTASGAQAAVRGEEGCLQYDYFTSVDDPDKLLLLEKWTNREAQKVHMGQPHMALIQEVKDRCAADTILETYDLP